MTPPSLAPPGWYVDPADGQRMRWWTGTEWTDQLAPAPVAPPRKRRPGIVGALVILVSTIALWAFGVCAELFWYDEHGSRLVLVALAAGPALAALLWIMTRRLRPADELSPWLLVLAATLGGFAAFVIPALVEPPWEFWTDRILNLPLVSPVIAGPLEEATKLAVVVIVSRWVTVRTARTGLFVGGAVGLGYAFFENIDYARNAAGNVSPGMLPAQHLALMARVALERDFFGSFAHPLWTALAAAALFAGSRGGRLRITRLAVAGFALAVVMHSLWDDIPLILGRALGHTPGLAGLAELGWALMVAAGGFVIWLVVSRRANRAVEATAQASAAPAAA